jgi:hypothetical protein
MAGPERTASAVEAMEGGGPTEIGPERENVTRTDIVDTTTGTGGMGGSIPGATVMQTIISPPKSEQKEVAGKEPLKKRSVRQKKSILS